MNRVLMSLKIPCIGSLIIATLWGCALGSTDSVAMSVSVSQDGRYAVSSHKNRNLYLWDLDKQNRTRLSDQANIYSAYFAKGRHAFLWQDLDNVVRLQDVNGDEIRSFTHVPTYGHVISPDGSVYVSSDENYVLRVIRDSEEAVLKVEGGSFSGFGKVFNLSTDGALLVSSGFGSPHDRDAWPIEEQAPLGYPDLMGSVLWSLDTLEPIAKLPGNTSKTQATLSPDGQWVVSGDENGIGLYWNTAQPDQRYRMASYFHGLFLGTHEAGDPRNRDRSGLIPVPDGVTETTIAVKFIHESRYYLRFGYNSHYTALFEVDNPWPLKYFDLGQRPFPATDSYARNLAIDTAPEAGILVMGQRDGSGILVYQFDPDELTLERVWVGR